MLTQTPYQCQRILICGSWISLKRIVFLWKNTLKKRERFSVPSTVETWLLKVHSREKGQGAVRSSNIDTFKTQRLWNTAEKQCQELTIPFRAVEIADLTPTLLHSSPIVPLLRVWWPTPNTTLGSWVTSHLGSQARLCRVRLQHPCYYGFKMDKVKVVLLNADSPQIKWIQFKVIFTVKETLVLGQCIFNTVHIRITWGAIFKNTLRGYGLIGLKWDGSNELAWVRSTSLGRLQFPKEAVRAPSVSAMTFVANSTQIRNNKVNEETQLN